MRPGTLAHAAGRTEIAVTERTVDVGVTEPEQLVDYRLVLSTTGWLPDRCASTTLFAKPPTITRRARRSSDTHRFVNRGVTVFL